MGFRIALFDYKVISTSPVGGCHLRLLQGLCREHEFTVFAVEFENPAPDRIRWVRIPAPTRPLALLFLVFHLLAPLYYWGHRIRHRRRFDLVQTVESYLSFGDVAYSHFGHRAYLKHHWKYTRHGGLRGAVRWLDHALRSFVEPFIYRRVKRVVVPSNGLARELVTEYPRLAPLIQVLPNPVDVERMRQPASFDRGSLRAALDVPLDAMLLVFVALGHFERKGLPLLLEALAAMDKSRPHLIIVGGEKDLVASYEARAHRLGLKKHVLFVGMRRDVRNYLWAADAFVLPSFYEVFSLVCLEAAAAGLPLISTRLNGVEEFLQDGTNGILVDVNARSIGAGIRQLFEMSPIKRHEMGQRAQEAVQRYATEHFVEAWRDFYRSEMEKRRSAGLLHNASSADDTRLHSRVSA